VFQPHSSENEPKKEETHTQLEPPINCLKRVNIQENISNLNPKKSPGYDLITGKILKGFPVIGIK
jgi:hypothetical protein